MAAKINTTDGDVGDNDFLQIVDNAIEMINNTFAPTLAPMDQTTYSPSDQPTFILDRGSGGALPWLPKWAPFVILGLIGSFSSLFAHLWVEGYFQRCQKKNDVDAVATPAGPNVEARAATPSSRSFRATPSSRSFLAATPVESAATQSSRSFRAATPADNTATHKSRSFTAATPVGNAATRSSRSNTAPRPVENAATRSSRSYTATAPMENTATRSSTRSFVSETTIESSGRTSRWWLPPKRASSP